MSTVTQSPSFITNAPDILNTNKGVSFALPILNSGTGTAGSVQITGITLGSATRLAPAAFPFFIGDMTPGNSVPVAALFDAASLAAGQHYLASVAGSYTLGGTTYAFRLNRSIVIPPSITFPIALLNAHVTVSLQPGLWSYTVTSDEPVGSTNLINSFALDVAVPFTVTGTPSGWGAKTDNQTYVIWYAQSGSASPAYIAPGASLSGFQIQAASTKSEAIAFTLTSHDSSSGNAGTVTTGSILSPSRLG